MTDDLDQPAPDDIVQADDVDLPLIDSEPVPTEEPQP